MRLRKDPDGQGLDAGPHTIAWHLEQHHWIRVLAATVSRYLARDGLVALVSAKRPKSFYLRFAVELPNECWPSIAVGVSAWASWLCPDAWPGGRGSPGRNRSWAFH